ncbi:MAG: FtsX-like permease family protein [Desulfobacterales bacterium]
MASCAAIIRQAPPLTAIPRPAGRKPHAQTLLAGWAAGLLSWILLSSAAAFQAPPTDTFMSDIRELAAVGDRSTGTSGCAAAAAFIRERFTELGLESVGSHLFEVPVILHQESRLFLPDRQVSVAVQPVLLNVVTPQSIPDTGLEGPLVYVGTGELHHFNGKIVEGAIVLMDIDSGTNWLHAASLGAAALIYLDGDATPKMRYEEKLELTPVSFPRLRMDRDTARRTFGGFETAAEGLVARSVRLTSKIEWSESTAENIYGIIPGADPALKDQLVVVEAFYDTGAWVPGLAPGADEAVGIVTLLDVARRLRQTPPGRSVLLLATAGHAQTLAGMREMIWSVRSRSRDLRDIQKRLKTVADTSRDAGAMLAAARERGVAAYLREKSSGRRAAALLDAINDSLKTEVDVISRKLMRLRLESTGDDNKDRIHELAQERRLLRRILWRGDLEALLPEETAAIEGLIPRALEEYRRVAADAARREKLIRSAKSFRNLAKSKEITAIVSLHLSSHGDGFGAFNYGWLYPLRARVNRTADYRILDDVLRQGAEALSAEGPGGSLYRDTLRPSRLNSWQSYFLDRPPLGGEVSALAGYLGVTLVTVNDARPLWGTPGDRPETIDSRYAARQSRQLGTLIDTISRAPKLHDGGLPRDGFATITGRARFLRLGELFPDQPAPGAVIMAFQGQGRYYAMVDASGMFTLKGVSTKKLVQDKVVIEAYRFDPENGQVVWAIDKKQTGKTAYRMKVQRASAETNLVMFGCRQSVIFDLLEPRTFQYMNKYQLIDARREARPVRYSFSRLDTWSSTLAALFLEPGTPWKLTLSHTVLGWRLLLLNADDAHPQGQGYLIDEWPFLYHTNYKVARDMWALLGPRIRALEDHGIYNERIAGLQQEGLAALEQARQAAGDRAYDRFSRAASRSWALATRVYSDVEDTQKDVLFGVLFYIALFVPFAFCMERLLFSFTDINRRIVAFCGILLLLIAVIYNVHPAFQLAYSPTVVILAFFIMGLSGIVTLIIFFRFEEEMTKLQQRARHLKTVEMGRWKAFVAAFLLGVSNLRRRRLRTALTCVTLIILTFTVMSFTAVKSLRQHTRLLFQERAPYTGYLFKTVNWNDLPPESLGTVANYFGSKAITAPRVWLEDEDRTRSLGLTVQHQDRQYTAFGVIGLSADEVRVTGMDKILLGGRWFKPAEKHAVMISDQAARELGIDPQLGQAAEVLLWGMPFRVVGVFSGRSLMDTTDLDGEPLSTVTFPSEISVEMTEVEMDAMESGEDVRTYESRYQHVDADRMVIVPDGFLLSTGGKLKGIAVKPADGRTTRAEAERLVDRFALTLFAGEPEGTFLYQASDTMSYSGVPNVVIPLVISIFIVLNTMIGSVYERKREIGIYTSVGLAPSHVSFLFIAEALAFAVISVVLGYLLAQTTARLFAGTSLWAGITVNYSSVSGVAAMVLVILVVLASVIYPARVAANIAIPDVNRSWKLPPAEGNRLRVTLPFLMNFHEHLSIGGFLLDHLDGHRDVSHGLFSAGQIDFSLARCTVGGNNIEQDGNEGESVVAAVDGNFLQLTTDIWLAPFDFGIMQKVAVAFCRSNEDPGYLEIRILLERLSGEANAWRRINKAFLHELRKTLLVWRSLDAAAKNHYAELMMADAEKRGIGLKIET